MRSAALVVILGVAALALPERAGRADGWTQLSPSGTAPVPRREHSAIHDAPRDRMVVFGGNSDVDDFSNEVWQLSLGPSPAWTALVVAGTKPGARYGHSAIYDPVRDRMLVFGGNVGGFNGNDVWALALAGTPAWTRLTPTGTPPVARRSPSAIYDRVRDRMIVFGGYTTGNRNDAWALALAGTPAWSLISAGVAPAARRDHSAIYDPVGDRMLVFGGVAASGARNDLWSLDFAGTPAWTQLAPGGVAIAARYGHSAVHDSVRHRMVAFGGVDAQFFDESLDLELTSPPEWVYFGTLPGTDPEARYDHSAIFDPLRDRMIVFGGGGGSGFRLNDCWALDAATPADVPMSGAVLSLGPGRPNPARGALEIEFALARAGEASLTVHDLAGRAVRGLFRGSAAAGRHTVRWDLRDERGAAVPPGVYFCVLRAAGERLARRIVALD